MSEATTVQTVDDKPDVLGLPAQRLEAFIRTRAKRKALGQLFEVEDKPLKELETLLGAWLQKYLLDNGLDNIKTKVGTAFLTTKTTASLKDPDEFMKFVIANQRFDLMDRKANTTAVRDFLKEKGELPPGANLSSFQTIGVHKKVGGKLEDD